MSNQTLHLFQNGILAKIVSFSNFKFGLFMTFEGSYYLGEISITGPEGRGLFFEPKNGYVLAEYSKGIINGKFQWRTTADCRVLGEALRSKPVGSCLLGINESHKWMQLQWKDISNEYMPQNSFVDQKSIKSKDKKKRGLKWYWDCKTSISNIVIDILKKGVKRVETKHVLILRKIIKRIQNLGKIIVKNENDDFSISFNDKNNCLTFETSGMKITNQINRNRLSWKDPKGRDQIHQILIENEHIWVNHHGEPIDKIEATGVLLWDRVFPDTPKLSLNWNQGLINWPIEFHSTQKFTSFLEKKVVSKIRSEREEFYSKILDEKDNDETLITYYNGDNEANNLSSNIALKHKYDKKKGSKVIKTTVKKTKLSAENRFQKVFRQEDSSSPLPLRPFKHQIHHTTPNSSSPVNEGEAYNKGGKFQTFGQLVSSKHPETSEDELQGSFAELTVNSSVHSKLNFPESFYQEFQAEYNQNVSRLILEKYMNSLVNEARRRGRNMSIDQMTNSDLRLIRVNLFNLQNIMKQFKSMRGQGQGSENEENCSDSTPASNKTLNRAEENKKEIRKGENFISMMENFFDEERIKKAVEQTFKNMLSERGEEDNDEGVFTNTNTDNNNDEGLLDKVSDFTGPSKPRRDNNSFKSLDIFENNGINRYSVEDIGRNFKRKKMRGSYVVPNQNMMESKGSEEGEGLSKEFKRTKTEGNEPTIQKMPTPPFVDLSDPVWNRLQEIEKAFKQILEEDIVDHSLIPADRKYSINPRIQKNGSGPQTGTSFKDRSYSFLSSKNEEGNLIKGLERIREGQYTKKQKFEKSKKRRNNSNVSGKTVKQKSQWNRPEIGSGLYNINTENIDNSMDNFQTFQKQDIDNFENSKNQKLEYNTDFGDVRDLQSRNFSKKRKHQKNQKTSSKKKLENDRENGPKFAEDVFSGQGGDKNIIKIDENERFTFDQKRSSDFNNQSNQSNNIFPSSPSSLPLSKLAESDLGNLYPQYSKDNSLFMFSRNMLISSPTHESEGNNSTSLQYDDMIQKICDDISKKIEGDLGYSLPFGDLKLDSKIKLSAILNNKETRKIMEGYSIYDLYDVNQLNEMKNTSKKGSIYKLKSSSMLQSRVFSEKMFSVQELLTFEGVIGDKSSKEILQILKQNRVIKFLVKKSTHLNFWDQISVPHVRDQRISIDECNQDSLLVDVIKFIGDSFKNLDFRGLKFCKSHFKSKKGTISTQVGGQSEDNSIHNHTKALDSVLTLFETGQFDPNTVQCLLKAFEGSSISFIIRNIKITQLYSEMDREIKKNPYWRQEDILSMISKNLKKYNIRVSKGEELEKILKKFNQEFIDSSFSSSLQESRVLMFDKYQIKDLLLSIKQKGMDSGKFNFGLKSSSNNKSINQNSGMDGSPHQFQQNGGEGNLNNGWDGNVSPKVGGYLNGNYNDIDKNISIIDQGFDLPHPNFINTNSNNPNRDHFDKKIENFYQDGGLPEGEFNTHIDTPQNGTHNHIEQQKFGVENDLIKNPKNPQWSKMSNNRRVTTDEDSYNIFEINQQPDLNKIYLGKETGELTRTASFNKQTDRTSNNLTIPGNLDHVRGSLGAPDSYQSAKELDSSISGQEHDRIVINPLKDKSIRSSRGIADRKNIKNVLGTVKSQDKSRRNRPSKSKEYGFIYDSNSTIFKQGERQIQGTRTQQTNQSLNSRKQNMSFQEKSQIKNVRSNLYRDSSIQKSGQSSTQKISISKVKSNTRLSENNTSNFKSSTKTNKKSKNNSSNRKGRFSNYKSVNTEGSLRRKYSSTLSMNEGQNSVKNKNREFQKNPKNLKLALSIKSLYNDTTNPTSSEITQKNSLRTKTMTNNDNETKSQMLKSGNKIRSKKGNLRGRNHGGGGVTSYHSLRNSAIKDNSLKFGKMSAISVANQSSKREERIDSSSKNQKNKNFKKSKKIKNEITPFMAIKNINTASSKQINKDTVFKAIKKSSRSRVNSSYTPQNKQASKNSRYGKQSSTHQEELKNRRLPTHTTTTTTTTTTTHNNRRIGNMNSIVASKNPHSSGSIIKTPSSFQSHQFGKTSMIEQSMTTNRNIEDDLNNDTAYIRNNDIDPITENAYNKVKSKDRKKDRKGGNHSSGRGAQISKKGNKGMLNRMNTDSEEEEIEEGEQMRYQNGSLGVENFKIGSFDQEGSSSRFVDGSGHKNGETLKNSSFAVKNVNKVKNKSKNKSNSKSKNKKKKKKSSRKNKKTKKLSEIDQNDPNPLKINSDTNTQKPVDLYSENSLNINLIQDNNYNFQTQESPLTVPPSSHNKFSKNLQNLEIESFSTNRDRNRLQIDTDPSLIQLNSKLISPIDKKMVSFEREEVNRLIGNMTRKEIQNEQLNSSMSDRSGIGSTDNQFFISDPQAEDNVPDHPHHFDKKLVSVLKKSKNQLATFTSNKNFNGNSKDQSKVNINIENNIVYGPQQGYRKGSVDKEYRRKNKNIEKKNKKKKKKSRKSSSKKKRKQSSDSEDNSSSLSSYLESDDDDDDDENDRRSMSTNSNSDSSSDSDSRSSKSQKIPENGNFYKQMQISGKDQIRITKNQQKKNPQSRPQGSSPRKEISKSKFFKIHKEERLAEASSPNNIPKKFPQNPTRLHRSKSTLEENLEQKNQKISLKCQQKTETEDLSSIKAGNFQQPNLNEDNKDQEDYPKQESASKGTQVIRLTPNSLDFQLLGSLQAQFNNGDSNIMNGEVIGGDFSQQQQEQVKGKNGKMVNVLSKHLNKISQSASNHQNYYQQQQQQLLQQQNDKEDCQHKNGGNITSNQGVNILHKNNSSDTPDLDKKKLSGPFRSHTKGRYFQSQKIKITEIQEDSKEYNSQSSSFSDLNNNTLNRFKSSKEEGKIVPNSKTPDCKLSTIADDENPYLLEGEGYSDLSSAAGFSNSKPNPQNNNQFPLNGINSVKSGSIPFQLDKRLQNEQNTIFSLQKPRNTPNNWRTLPYSAFDEILNYLASHSPILSNLIVPMRDLSMEPYQILSCLVEKYPKPVQEALTFHYLNGCNLFF